MSVSHAPLLLVSVSYNSAAFDEPVGFAFMEEVDSIEIPSAGKVGPTGQGILRKRVIAEVEWIGNTAPVASYDGSSTGGNSVVATFSCKDPANTRTVTLSSMRPFGRGMSTGSVPFRYKQTFMYQGSYDSDPVSCT